eukprot:5881316-Prymnesium_polylepis.1
MRWLRTKLGKQKALLQVKQRDEHALASAAENERTQASHPVEADRSVSVPCRSCACVLAAHKNANTRHSHCKI